MHEVPVGQHALAHWNSSRLALQAIEQPHALEDLHVESIRKTELYHAAVEGVRCHLDLDESLALFELDDALGNGDDARAAVQDDFSGGAVVRAQHLFGLQANRGPDLELDRPLFVRALGRYVLEFTFEMLIHGPYGND